MKIEKTVIETVIFDRNDIIKALIHTLREKGYKDVKEEQIMLEPETSKAICKIQNTFYES